MPDAKSTQSFVPVKEVRNGIVLLKDGGYRGILMCSSTNFALKSPDEQKGIISGFQTFLNTLDFSVEIVIHSRKMDIRPYLATLAEREAAQQTELLRVQVREYAQFIRNFIEGADIMSKMFYIVVPYTPSSLPTTSSLPFVGNKKPAQPTGLTETFSQENAQLQQRMALVSSGLTGTGIRAVPLGTEEVIELMYRSFNLNELETPIKLTN
jgi:hypothetical protein